MKINPSEITWAVPEKFCHPLPHVGWASQSRVFNTKMVQVWMISGTPHFRKPPNRDCPTFFLTFPVFPEVIHAWCSKIQSKHFWRLTRTCNACKDWSNKPPRRLSPGIFSTARGWRKPQFLGYPIYKMVYNWLVVSTLWKMMEFVSWEGWQPIYYGKKNVWSHQPV